MSKEHERAQAERIERLAQEQAAYKQAAKEIARQQSSPEAKNVKIVSQIVSNYHRTHTYIGKDIFVCGDMASDVWNMVQTKGINAKILIGNVERSISSPLEVNHAWVLAEVSPGSWLALETTGGFVV